MTDAEESAVRVLDATGRDVGGGTVETQLTRIAAELESSSQARKILVDHLTEALRLNARSYLEIDDASAEELAALDGQGLL